MYSLSSQSLSKVNLSYTVIGKTKELQQPVQNPIDLSNKANILWNSHSSLSAKTGQMPAIKTSNVNTNLIIIILVYIPYTFLNRETLLPINIHW